MVISGRKRRSIWREYRSSSDARGARLIVPRAVFACLQELLADIVSSIEPAFLVCAAEVRSPGSPLPNSDADSAHEGGPSVPSPRRSTMDGDGDISMSTPASGGYRERPGWATAPSTAPTSRPGSSSGGQRLTIPQDSPDERLAAPLPRIRTRNEPDELSEGSSGDEGSGRSLHGEGPDSKRHRPNSEGARNLYGSLHIPGIRVVAPEGGMGMWFLFTVRQTFSIPVCVSWLRVVKAPRLPHVDEGSGRI